MKRIATTFALAAFMGGIGAAVAAPASAASVTVCAKAHVVVAGTEVVNEDQCHTVQPG